MNPPQIFKIETQLDENRKTHAQMNVFGRLKHLISDNMSMLIKIAK